MKVVNRTSKVPVYIFSKFDDIKKKLSLRGIEVIDLGIGDPDLPTPDFILEYMTESIKNTKYHRYPPYWGIDEFRKAVANYYKRHYDVELDHETEIAALIGSKEGIAHLILSLTDPEDYVLIPDPGYPVYMASSIISGCNVHKMNLTEANNYLPDLGRIYPEVACKSKLMIVNYPNNPTGAVANPDFFRSLVNFGSINNIVIANDGAYMDICSEGCSPISLLQTEGAMDTCVEFGTLSKSYNMTGWRLGYIAGNSEVIKKLMILKTNFDSSQFSAIQQAGAYALENGDFFIEQLNSVYNERRKIIVDALKSRGLKVYESKAAFYVWFKIPDGYKSEEFAAEVLEKTGIMITPGNAFGNVGEGNCRISLTVSSQSLEEAASRISAMNF